MEERESTGGEEVVRAEGVPEGGRGMVARLEERLGGRGAGMTGISGDY